MEAWQHVLNSGKSSIDNEIFQGRTYQISIGGVSSARIIGNRCQIQFKDSGGHAQCLLGPGDYSGAAFAACGNDRVTQYTVIQGPQGSLFM